MSHFDDLKGNGKHRNGGNKFRFLHVSASKSMAKEMKQNREVQKKITSGKLDDALKTPIEKAIEKDRA